MKKRLLQFDVSNLEFEKDEEDVIKINLEKEDIAKVNFFNLIRESKYIRDKYKYSEAVTSIQNEINEFRRKFQISSESIKHFFQIIQQEKVQISIEEFKEIYILCDYFCIQKYMRELDKIMRKEIVDDIDLMIQILLDLNKNENEFQTKLTSKIECFLIERINDCFENKKFIELPTSSIYRIIERCNKEKINLDIFVDFIISSANTHFSLFKFVELHKLTDDEIEKIFNFINDQQENLKKLYLEHMPFDFLFIQQMKQKKEEFFKEMNSAKEELEQIKIKYEQSKEELNQTKEELNQTKEELDQLKNEFKKYSKTVLISGYDKYNQFGENANNKNKDGYPIINPPVILSFDNSSLLSYSVYGWHSVQITSDGTLKGTGYNGDHRISSSLPKTGITQFTEFCIKDARGHKLSPVSAVCCGGGTLYMFSKGNNSIERQLVLCDCYINGGEPVFLDIGNQEPVSLFGGYSHAAAINREGQIIFINRHSIRKSPESRIEAVSLQEGEKASFVACCEESIIVLSSKGRVFSSPVSNIKFTVVDELSNEEIVSVSGTYKHFLAVNKEGRVFGRGSNEFGKLGLGKGKMSSSVFTEISSLLGHEIRAAYAGCGHSLFVTRKGKVFSCGTNQYGQLMLSSGPGKDVYSPAETTITGGAEFCIAGDCLSAVFIGSMPPPNTPNMRVLHHH